MVCQNGHQSGFVHSVVQGNKLVWPFEQGVILLYWGQCKN